LMFFMMMISNTYSQTSEVASGAASSVSQSGLSLWSSPLFWVYAFAIFGLLLVIIAIGSVLVGLVNNKLSEKIGKGASIIILLMLFAYNPANAQTAETVSSTTEAVIGGLDPNTIVVLSIVVFIELFVILYLFSILQKMLVALGYKPATEPRWTWSAIMKRMTKSVPLERESEVATDHNYDGIIELDNSLPPWWVYMFYATIVFSIVYIAYFQFGGGPTQLMEYDKAIAEAKIEKAAMLKKTASNVDENSVVVLADAADISKGKSSYITKCAACHGQNGEGGVGPNLTDEFWIHGGGIKNIFKTIKYGVQEKGMIAWQAQMQPSEMQQVASFILTLQGTKPANGKAPQGDLYKEEAAAPDSTVASATNDTTVVASAK
jgi:cytochrome c oxidase cbb3-type subunit III